MGDRETEKDTQRKRQGDREKERQHATFLLSFFLHIPALNSTLSSLNDGFDCNVSSK